MKTIVLHKSDFSKEAIKSGVWDELTSALTNSSECAILQLSSIEEGEKKSLTISY